MKTFKKASGLGMALALGLLVATAASAAEHDGSYGYLRVVEGPATLIQTGTNDRESAEVNQPVLAGDRLQVPGRSRVELVLADRNLLRLDGGSEVVLERLAASPDTNDRATVLRLLEGNLQLVVLEESYGEELPRVETPNATIYIQHYGIYRVTADRGGWSELVVRRGKAEIVTERGRETVRADEEAIIEGERMADVDVRAATGYDALERWAKYLDEESAAADLRYVDDNLRYSAAPLSRYGSWLSIDGRPYWRPVVTAGWRPYWHGRWVYTPSGLTWVSYEPWGWVPYHYGSWDYMPAYGWVWAPGYRYAPAWVYWYWGSSYAGWCPTGYYTRFYGPRFGLGFGFHSGVYGYAGGPWDYYDHWTFVPTGYFGYRHGYRDGYRDGRRDDRDVRRFAVPIDELRRRVREVPRGILTTDTRSLTPERLKNPDDVLRTLRESGLGRGRSELPDMTQFVGRKPDLSPGLRTAIATRELSRHLDGTPLKPDTLGRLRPPQDVLEGRAPTRVPDPGKPRVILGDDRRPDVSEPPTARRPEVRPEVREQLPRAGRPDAGEDGGAPRPTRPDADDLRKPTVRPEVRPETRPETRPTVRPDVRPDAREIPRTVRPRPDDDGGAPRPDGPRVAPRTSSDDRPEPPAARPDVRESRPSVRPSPRETERPEPPVRRDNLERYERPERPEPEPRSERPEPRYERPEPRYERPEPRYERPEPRPEPRAVPDRPSPRTSEPSRPSERPSVRPSPPPSSRSQGGSDRGRAREARPRPPRDRD